MSAIYIEVNGIQYTNFESARVVCQLDAIASQFEFVAVSTKNEPLPFQLDDACTITIDDEKVLTGFIEKINVNYTSTDHTITIAGRSKTSDIIDSMINNLELRPPITLQAAIEKVISHIGASIQVIDNLGDIDPFNKAEDLLSPGVGENAFQFIEKLARKRQVLLTTNGDGNIVITQSGEDTAPTGLQNVVGGNENNIESASVSYDSTERFNKYISKSQLNITAINFSGAVGAKDIVSQKSPVVVDEETRASRQLVIQAESASSDQQNQKRAQWEANIRKSRSKVYSTSISNFSEDGILWRPNQLVSINDDFSGINAQMLVNTVTFVQDISGSNTTIALVDRDAYTLRLNEPSEGNSVGAGLTPQFN